MSDRSAESRGPEGVPCDPSGRVSLLGLDAEGMRACPGPLSELPLFRARQVARWLYGRGKPASRR